MSKNPTTRGQRVALMRTMLAKPELRCGPREPVLPLSLVERCRGGEMARWDARIDLALTIGQLLMVFRTGLSPAVDRAIAKAGNAPSARTVNRLRRLLVREVDGDLLGSDDARLVIDLATSLLFHEAEFGCSIANGAVASMCLSQAIRDLREGRDAGSWFALRAACHYAENAHEDMTRAPYIPDPLYSRLSFYDRMADLWSSAFGLVVSAREHAMAQEDAQDAILRGGVGVPSEDLAAFDGLYPHDVEGLIRTASPTLVVIADGGLDHLPGSPTSGSTPSSRGATPRGEWQPIVGKAMPLVHGADVRAAGAELDAEFPWLADVTATLLQDLVGARYTRIRPTLLLGRPGAGKTRFARRVGEVLRLPVTVYSAAGVADAAFGGTSRQWSTGRACVPLQAIQRGGVANPCIVIDEIEKAGSRTENGRLTDSLIAMLEPEGAARFFDPYLEAPVNVSAPTFLATANDPTLPGPLLDRLRILKIPEPRAQDLPVVAAAIVGGIRAERGLNEVWMPELDADELGLIARRWRGGSLRPLRRLVETVIAGRDALARRH